MALLNLELCLIFVISVGISFHNLHPLKIKDF